MKIVIVGAGEVGTHLAKLLSKEEQDITLIDSDGTKLENIDSNYNLMTAEGSPTSFSVLSEANTANADLFIAVTPFETTNILACQIAKSLGAQTTVARIDNYEFMKDEYSTFFQDNGVDNLIYPEYLAAQEILTSMERTWVRNWFELHDGEIIIVGVKVRSGASIVNKQLKELYGQTAFHVSAIKRRHETIIPRGDDSILENDIVYFATTKENVDTVREVCGKTDREVHKIMIMGGNKIAIRFAALVGDKYKIKIIDNDRAKCTYLSQRCPDAEIIHGDARDNDVLREEGIDDIDAFVALTESSETNILGCMTAREMGAWKTVAEVENIQFISEAEGLNIGTIINKKLLASSKIFQLLLDADSSTAKCLALTDAEVAEIIARPKSKITRSAVRDLRLPREMTLAGLIRDGKGMLVDGNTTILSGDHVVVFCLSGSIHKIEKYFA